MDGGMSFMMTDMGIVPIRADGTPLVPLTGGDPSEMSAGGAALAAATEQQERGAHLHNTPKREPQKPVLALTPAPAAEQTLTPKDLIKQAKLRIKTIKRELAALKRLETELVELERLVAAAKAKPVALVRNINSRIK